MDMRGLRIYWPRQEYNIRNHQIDIVCEKPHYDYERHCGRSHWKKKCFKIQPWRKVLTLEERVIDNT